ncbi:MAG TPA: hypothetical protein VNK04_12545 [Gemmataceae bacterium]|nr:hypothetical protein [Gemmataceae bacterium]
MRRHLRWAGCALLLAIALPLAVADVKQDPKNLDKEPTPKKDLDKEPAKDKEPAPKTDSDKAKKDLDKEPASKKDLDKAKKDLDKEPASPKKNLDKEPEKKPTEKLVPLGKISGLITKVGDDRVLTLKVSFVYTEPNPSALRQQQDLARRQIEIMQNRNPVERARQLAQLQFDIANNQRNLYTTKEVKKDIEIQATENVKVRSMQPPMVYDEKGNPRRHTPQELRELKGEGNLPGYMSDFDSLRTGQIVTVHLARKGGTTGPAPKSKDLDRDLEKRLTEAGRPYATMIVIEGETINR